MFLNVSFSTDNVNKIIFDVLIDADLVTKTDADEISNSLIEVLKDYGAIIVKIIDDTITKEIVASFSKQLYAYTSSTKNKVQLAIIIGDDASEESYKLAIKSERRRIGYFVTRRETCFFLFVYASLISLLWLYSQTFAVMIISITAF